ncbi:MAG: YraN family protein [Methylocella sp.]
MLNSVDRREAHWRGLIAERLAEAVLRLKFYSILARRFRVHGGEIDIIARRGDTIAFVEVKVRPSLDEASSAITLAKRRRISRAARAWIAAHPSTAALTWRGDAVFVAPWRWPRHDIAAFELNF